jgi:hypothetical protein
VQGLRAVEMYLPRVGIWWAPLILIQAESGFGGRTMSVVSGAASARSSSVATLALS